MNRFNVNFTLVSNTYPNSWLLSVIEEELYKGELIVEYNCFPGDEEGSYEIRMELQLIKSPDNWLSETIQENVFAHKGESIDNLIITLA